MFKESKTLEVEQFIKNLLISDNDYSFEDPDMEEEMYFLRVPFWILFFRTTLFVSIYYL